VCGGCETQVASYVMVDQRQRTSVEWNEPRKVCGLV
jgi:hypothetical protein